MTYTDSIQFLYHLRWFGTKLGLTNILKLAALAGDPHRNLRFIHVAGTNGKGSTCAMLESIYRCAGLRVGLFTSPHLVSFGERIQVNREPISQQDVVRLVLEIQPLLREFSADEHPTFFEVVTIMALRYFAAQNCDLVIWETGMGGRLDATNIVTPLASVITNVQYDHQAWLGETLAQIAFEKAGIIKNGIPIITSALEPEALQVIQKIALEKKAPIKCVSFADADGPFRNATQVSLQGAHQRLNAALAIATVSIVSRHIPVNEEAVRIGLATVQWPGRLQLLTRSSGNQILLDGAHNFAGARSLVDALQENFASARPVLILGILQDKEWQQICHLVAPLADKIYLVPVSSDRTANPAELQQMCHQANPSAETIVCESVVHALERAARDPFVVVTGSLYLVGEALEYLEGTMAYRDNERGLNEWSSKA